MKDHSLARGVRLALTLLCLGGACVAGRAEVDVTRYERLVAEGKAIEALGLLERELAKAPGNLRLRYDYGVAAYAAGRFQEALVAFDQVERSPRAALADRAHRQKGNAEFHLGLAARANNLDETIHRWKSSLDQYRTVLTHAPEDGLAKTNYVIVRRLLLELLLDGARQQLAQAHQPSQPVEQQIDALRGAMDGFREARQTDEQNADAQAGEQQTRSELAHTLADQGAKNAAAQRDQPLPPQLARMQRGVDQLEDAHALLPADQPIADQLDRAKLSVADVLTQQAQEEVKQAKQTPAEPPRVALLEKAIRHAGAALDYQPRHEPARRTLQDAQEDLALIHEKKGDELVKRAEKAPLEPAAQRLDDALTQYQQAQELQPEDGAVRTKIQKTETKLEAVLQQLAEALAPDPPKQPGKPTESLEQKAARLEGAQHALQDLEQLRPQRQTAAQLTQVEKKLARVRELMAEPAEATAQQLTGTPPAPLPETLDLPRMPQKKPPVPPGEFKSEPMLRKLRDY